jgi:dTDP-4-dehydrorhamnose reductase
MGCTFRKRTPAIYATLDFMKILVFGATGMLGKALLGRWKEDQVLGLGSAQADIRNPEQVDEIVSQAAPDWIVLSAAYTDVDGCELNPTLASTVNTHGALHVAKAAARAHSRLLFISTDYVFDGNHTSPYETTHPRNPISAYGKSKAEAEEKISRILPECCIVRTSWLFGPGGKCFPDTILKLAGARPQLDVVNDQRGSPTYTGDLADAIVRLCRADARDIVHATNQGDCTWYDFAREILRQAGSNTVVRPTTSDKFVRPAPRPRYSVLAPQSLLAHGIEMRPWQATLSEYFALRSATG